MTVQTPHTAPKFRRDGLRGTGNPAPTTTPTAAPPIVLPGRADAAATAPALPPAETAPSRSRKTPAAAATRPAGERPATDRAAGPPPRRQPWNCANSEGLLR